MDAGPAHSTVKLRAFQESDADKQIEPKSYTIDISFENLGLTLKAVSFILFFVSPERAESHIVSILAFPSVAADRVLHILTMVQNSRL